MAILVPFSGQKQKDLQRLFDSLFVGNSEQLPKKRKSMHTFIREVLNHQLGSRRGESSILASALAAVCEVLS